VRTCHNSAAEPGLAREAGAVVEGAELLDRLQARRDELDRRLLEAPSEARDEWLKVAWGQARDVGRVELAELQQQREVRGGDGGVAEQRVREHAENAVQALEDDLQGQGVAHIDET
jgi:hypothetical protein